MENNKNDDEIIAISIIQQNIDINATTHDTCKKTPKKS